MPYFLNKSASNVSVNIPTFTVAENENFTLKFSYRSVNSGFNRPFGDSYTYGFKSRVLVRHDGSAGVYLTNGQFTAESANWPLPSGYSAATNGVDFNTYEFIRTSNVVEFKWNGVSQGTRVLSGIFEIGAFFTHSGSHDQTNNALKYFELSKSGQSRRYANTTGTGSVWNDEISAQDGTVLNAPVNNSQWVYYADGGTVQAISTGGVATKISSGLANSAPVNTQLSDTGGTGLATRSGAVASQIGNIQAIDTSSSAAINKSGSAVSQPISEQAFDTASALQALRSGQSITEPINAQGENASGITNAMRNGTANTESVNTVGAVQSVETGGVTGRLASAIAASEIVETQQVNTAGVAARQRSGVSKTEYINFQTHESGGTAGRNIIYSASSTWLSTQHFESFAIGAYARNVYAITEIYDDGYSLEFIKAGLNASIVGSKYTATLEKPTYSATIIQ